MILSFFQDLWDILTVTPLWELLLIFLAKIIEVSVGTLRNILVYRGYRKQGVLLALFEIFLWVFVASTVINGLTESPMKGIVYGFGFAAGVYVGSRLEEKLAYGKILIQTIVSVDLGIKLTKTLRDLGYGVTTVPASGKDAARSVLMIYTNRRGNQKIVQIIQEVDPTAMIISNDVSSLVGGRISPIRPLFK